MVDVPPDDMPDRLDRVSGSRSVVREPRLWLDVYYSDAHSGKVVAPSMGVRADVFGLFLDEVWFGENANARLGF